MMELLYNKYVLVAITFGVFYAARGLQARLGKVWLNPILITIAILIALVKFTGLEFETYAESGSIIEFWLQPAIVALGVPLYQQLAHIREHLVPIMLSQLIGCVCGMLACVITAKLLGASDAVIASLAPKSVTTPIAIEISKSLGGIPSLTAAIVVLVGLFGAIFGFRILQIGRVKSPKAQGLSMGAASHAIGTSQAWSHGAVWGTYSSLGLIFSGIITAILAPILLDLIK